VVRRDDDIVRELARADFAHDHMRRARRFLTTLVAVTSVFPWLRSFALSWMVPRAFVSLGVACWAAFALVAICVGAHEWSYARERRFHLRRLSTALHEAEGE
jgi:hypothetical protein